MDIKNLSLKEIKELENLEDLILELKEDGRKNRLDLALSLERKIEKKNQEIDRVKNLYNFDKSFGYKLIAGVDEVGRGPLAGPITAAAVILDYKSLDDIILYINDSKKLSFEKRRELSLIIKEKALAYSIASVDNEGIDDKGIAWANNRVFQKSIEELEIKPDFVLSDGYPIFGIKMKSKGIVKGDTKSAAIAAASIIAKDYRDNMMIEYSKIYPYYGFENNMGYGTREHIEGIKKSGPCILHRMCFLNNIL